MDRIKRLSLRATVLMAIGLAGVVEAAGWAVDTAPVASLSQYSGNTPAFWGYHQSIIARAGSRVYAGLLEPWDEGHKQQWGLFEQTGEGWSRVYASPKSKLLNQPPILGKVTNNTFVDALGVLTRYHEQWIRPIEDWVPDSHKYRRI